MVNNKNIDEDIAKVIESVMEISLQKLDKKQKLNAIPEWDSFNNLMLISRFQEEFDIEFTALDIEKTQTIQQIFDLIKTKLSKKSS